MRKVILILVLFLVFTGTCNAQLPSFDSSYVIASSNQYSYKNPSFNTHDRNDFLYSVDCIVYEKHSLTGSNIIARYFDFNNYQPELEITTDTNVMNINPSISYYQYHWSNWRSVIVWQSNKNGNWDLYYTVKDSGSGWSPPVPIAMTPGDEINPQIFRRTDWENKFYLAYEKSGDIYLRYYNALTNQWTGDTNITANTSSLCTSPFFLPNNIAYTLLDADSIKKITYNPIGFDTSGTTFSIGTPVVNQTIHSQFTPSFAKFFKGGYSYSYDTLGSKKVMFCWPNYSNKEVVNPNLPGDFYNGIVSYLLIITDGSYSFHGYGAIRKKDDSTFVYALGYNHDSSFYIGDQNVQTKIAISEPTLGGNLFKIRLVWEQEFNGKTALFESYLVDVATGIEPLSSELPSKFSLYQNYPNPFNPSTKIKFDIPKQGNVKLTVYDISGKEVNVLVNSELKAGSYEYNFDGSGLSSGVYFYKLQSGDFVETRRMILLK